MVFVLNHDKQPLSPCHEAAARKLLRNGRASIWRKYPFTIIMNEQKEVEQTREHQEYRLKIDYGSKHTGLAILQRDKVIWLAQIEHKTTVKRALEKRSNYRRRRRSKNLRYRKARWKYRRRKDKWLPPSLQCRVDNIKTWVKRILRSCPVTHISYETCKFDTQLMQNPDISGVEYQQGTLMGYEVREYLLEKFNRKCCYCGKESVPLEIEHITPKSRGGTNRIDNLCISCRMCNETKGTMTAEEFGHRDIQKQVEKTLKDTAIINATKWKVYDLLVYTGLDVECGTGARTKMNRLKLGIEKDHHFDACCVGQSTPDKLYFKVNNVMYIKAMGRGSHCRTNVDDSGFPVSYMPRQKYFFGFQTGDMVKADVPKGVNKGVWYGRVLCRSSGSFDIKTKHGRKSGINHRYIKLIQNNDGYEYKLEFLSKAS